MHTVTGSWHSYHTHDICFIRLVNDPLSVDNESLPQEKATVCSYLEMNSSLDHLPRAAGYNAAHENSNNLTTSASNRVTGDPVQGCPRVQCVCVWGVGGRC